MCFLLLAIYVSVIIEWLPGSFGKILFSMIPWLLLKNAFKFYATLGYARIDRGNPSQGLSDNITKVIYIVST